MRLSIAALLVLLVFQLIACGPQINYYVAANGSDSNSGRSPDAPWRTIAKVNATTFPAGTTISFKGGETFTGTIAAPTGGTKTNPITIASYGSGAAIISSGTGRCISAQTIDGWAVNVLKCVGNGTTNTVDGIYIDNGNMTGTLSNGITLSNIEVAGYGRNGIQLSGQSGAGFANVTIKNCSIHNNTFGDTNVGANAGILVIGTFPTSAPHSNITVQYCQVSNNNGLVATDTIGNGIFFGGVTSGLIDHNVVRDNGSAAVSPSGPSGIQLGYSRNVTVQYNEVYDQKSGNSTDGDGIDLDIGCANNTVQYNWVHDNVGAGLMGFQNGSAGAPSWTGNTYRHNITENNGTSGTQTVAGEFVLVSADTITNLRIYGNKFFAAGGRSPPIIKTEGSAASSAIFANNTLHTFVLTSSKFIAINPNGGDWEITGNAYIHNLISSHFTFNGTTYTSLAAFRSGTGQEGGSGIGIRMSTTGAYSGALGTDLYRIKSDDRRGLVAFDPRKSEFIGERQSLSSAAASRFQQ